MSYPEEVTTARLTLRRWQPEDRPAHEAIWSDPEVWASLRGGQPGSPAEEAERALNKKLRQWADHGFGIWAVIPRGEREPVGWTGAWYPDFVPAVQGEIEIGWTLRRPYWGRGYVTEAARQAIASTFEHIDPDRVISLIAASNDRSAAVAGRLGMRHHFTARTVEDLELRVFELPRDEAGSG